MAEPAAAAPLLIGVAGPSCSGKSTLASALCAALPGCGTVLSLDWYYRDFARLPPSEQAGFNFDAPEAMDRALFVEHVRQLSRGRAVWRPAYDFASHSRSAEGVPVAAADHLVVEGLFALLWPEVRCLYRASFYVHADEATCLARRLARDTVERGRSRESVLAQFEGQVRPMCRQHVLPTRLVADAVVDGAAPAAQSLRLMLAVVQARTAAAGRSA